MNMIFAAPTTQLNTVKILLTTSAVKMDTQIVTESAMMITYHAVTQDKQIVTPKVESVLLITAAVISWPNTAVKKETCA